MTREEHPDGRYIHRLGLLTAGILPLVLKPLFSSSTDGQSPVTGQSGRSSPLQIRAVHTGDLTGLAEILADSFHSQDGILGWAYPLLRLGIYEDLRTRLRSTSRHQTCLVAVNRRLNTAAACSYNDPDDLAGTVEMGLRSTHPWASTHSQYLYISNLAVRPSYRRQGVAGQLLLGCERVALSWGFQDLYLHVMENNHQARQLYCKLGYKLHRTDATWSTWLLGRPRQLFLHKHLSAPA